MANKQNITVGIDLEANITKAQQALANLQKLFTKLNLTEGIQKEFSNLFSHFENEFEKISNRTAGGKVGLIDVNAVQKSIERIDNLYSILSRKLETRGIAAAGLVEDQAALRGITAAMKIYEKAISESEKKQSQLTKAVQAEKDKRKDLLDAQKKQKVSTQEEINLQKLKVSEAKKAENAAKKELEMAKATLDAKIAASKGKYQESDIGTKGSGLRKTDAYKAFKTASDKYSATKETHKNERSVFQGMVTAEMQADQIKKVEEAIISAETALKNFNETGSKNMLSEAFESAKKALEELEGVDLTSYGIDIKDIKSIEDLKRAFEGLENATNEKASENIRTIIEQIKALGDASQKTNEELDKTSMSLNEKSERKSQMEGFQSRIKAFLGLEGAARLLRSALRGAMQTIQELDSTMTQMAVVTDLGVGDYWEQLPQYTSRANELGLAIQDVYKADTLFYQQGLKTQEVVAISTETMKMAAIAGLDTAVATDRMTAALRGFNMELNELSAKKVADVYSELAAITASDVDEISSAMTKTASIASSAGMEFETTAAFLSQIIETTRESAETAGTALKTIVARFQELKKDPSEIGLVDGEMVDVNKIETALRSVGVSLRDASGQFRELDDVFIELSSKWDGLDKNTQRYIATIAAGSRQQSRFIAMMSDYGRTQELVAAANTSAGASQRQFEKTTESLEYKINQLKNAWAEFTMGIMNSSFVKLGVEILTKFLNVLNRVTEGFGGFTNSISKIGTVMAIFRIGKSMFEKMKAPLTQFFIEIVEGARKAGEDATKAFVEGAENPPENTPNKEEGPADSRIQLDEDSSFVAKFGAGAANAVGAGQLITGVGKLKEAGKKRDELNWKYGPQVTEREQVKKALKKERKKQKKGEGNAETIADLEAQLQSLNHGLEEYDKGMSKVEETAKTGWDAVTDGIGKASEALMAGGVVVGMLGQAFIDAGAEEFGETLQTIGTWMTTIGSALQVLIPLINMLKPAFAGAGTAGTTSGMASSAAWGVVGIIVMAVMAAIMVAIVVVLAVMKAIESSSPEAKLKEAEAAAERTAEAAKNAKEEFEGLGDAIDKLKDKYKSLKDLKKGTEEWNRAVLEINSSVMDLISRYPELANLVTRGVGQEEGVLKLDFMDPEIQKVFTKAYEKMVLTSNLDLLAKINTEEKRIDLQKEKIEDEITLEVDLEDVAERYINGELQNTDDYRKYLQNQEEYKDSAVMGDHVKSFKYLIEEFGDEIKNLGYSLEKNDLLKETTFKAISQSIFSLIEKEGKKEEQLSRMQVIASGDAYWKAYEEISKKLDEENTDLIDDSGFQTDITDLSSDKLDGKLSTLEIYEAFEQAGYKNFELDQEDGVISYTDAEGNPQEDEITHGEIQRILANYYATKVSVQRAENADRLLAEVKDDIKEEKGEGWDSNDLYNAIARALENAEGGALTQKDVDILDDIELETLKSYFSDLPQDLKNIYGDGSDIAQMIYDANALADGAFKDVEKILEDNYKIDKNNNPLTGLSAELQKGILDKLDEVADKTEITKEDGTIVSKESVLAKFGELNTDGKLTPDAIRRINATNWSDIEELNALQYELVNIYGLESTKVQGLISEIKEANYATSKFEFALDEFGELYKATEAVGKATEELTRLQWEYNQALREGGKGIANNIEEMMKQYKTSAENNTIRARQAQDNINKLYQQGMGASGLEIYGLDLSTITTLNADGSISYDPTEVVSLLQNGKLKQDAWENFLESMEEQREIYLESQESARESVEAIQELDDSLRESYDELFSSAIEAYTEYAQKQIDLQSDTLEATKEASQKITDKIQETIDDFRTQRENEKTEKSISDKYSQLAYLSMDTSGSNLLQQTELSSQIKEEQQAYEDSLIDQTLQELQDANEKTAEQLAEQIELQQQQLDAYLESASFQQHISTLVEEMLREDNPANTKLGRIMEEIQTVGMTPEQRAEWQTQFSSSVSQAAEWGAGKDDRDETIATIKQELSTMAGLLADESRESGVVSSTYEGKKKILDAAGFDADKTQGWVKKISSGAGKTDAKSQEDADRAKTMIAKAEEIALKDSSSASKSKIEEYQGAFEGAGYTIGDTNGYGGVYSKDAYYKSLTEEDLATGKATTYETYLSDTLSANKITAVEAYGGMGIDGTWEDIDDEWEEGTNFEIKIGDEWDNWVELGPKATPEELTYLNDIYANTGKKSIALLKSAHTSNSGLGKDFIFIKNGNEWWRVKDMTGENDEASSYEVSDLGTKWVSEHDSSIYLKKVKKYQTGGLVNFTGPAWLDGTPSRPEYILNATQTEHFFSLVDVLEGIDTKDGSKKPTGDNYFDIEINVEKLENDYDVEQVADKIRRMIYEDATYRNVNAINHIR